MSLTNGRNLDGWWFFGSNTDGFRVNDEGVIEYMEPGGKAILTAKRYGDFILRLDFQIEEGGNSGIFLRAPRDARQSYIGMEFQIHGDPGVVPSDDSTGAIYKVKAARVNPNKPFGEWNALEVRLEGTHMYATLNGEILHDFDMAEYEELKYRLKEGYIGLQDHGHYVAFRNVRIKEL